MKRDTSNFLQKNLCTYYLYFFKKAFIEFEVFWKSPESTSSFLGADLDPTGQVYVRGISVEHSHKIFPIHLRKMSLWNSGDILILWNAPCFKLTSPILCYAKTHKFKSLEEINVDQLKLRPISDQTGTYICNHGLLYLHGRLYCIFALKIVSWKLKGIAMVPKLQSE